MTSYQQPQTLAPLASRVPGPSNPFYDSFTACIVGVVSECNLFDDLRLDRRACG
jgi:hypothetical protein